MLLKHEVHLIGESILELFAEWEPEEQIDGKNYRDVLIDVMQRFGRRLGFPPNEAEIQGFVECIPRGMPFPDTVESLQSLANRFDLAIISNIDEDLIALTLELIAVPFKHVITAQTLGGYKPNTEILTKAFGKIGESARTLHVAQSLFHDIAPVHELGIDTVWIKRDRVVGGAVRVVNATPDWTYDDLRSFTTDILST